MYRSTKETLDKMYEAIVNTLSEAAIMTYEAAAVDVELYWPGLFAKAFEGVNMRDLITNIGSGVGAAPAVDGAPAAASAAAPAAEPAKEEKKEEEPEEMGFGLFD
ncbi:unnamed protein product [Parnassius apollo]|uniref:(apollo) hypothetical protein n=1 Tax=Parnassius apollo TaxID=110799 RepID=A0A8S3W0B2_PARAO|nr:unnamed protein product [Parnassius apollo]